MQIGLLSDTHNHVENTQAALEIFRRRGIMRLLHCGDITRPDTVLLFSGFQVTFVQGNNDYWRNDLIEMMLAIGGQRVLPLRWTGEIAGKRIAVTHGDVYHHLSELIHGGRHDYVIHGHSHRRRDERQGATRVINPGALGGKREQSRSAAILDLEYDRLEFVGVQE
jgi:putative phosphoesterase